MPGLVKVDSKGISALTSAEDIGRILLTEITGDQMMGKAALFHLAGMAAEAGGINSQERNQDIIEYILLTGSAASQISPAQITEYLKLKEACGRIGQDIPYNGKYRQLLKEVMVPKWQERSLLESIASDLSRLYKDAITGTMPRLLPAYENGADTYLASEIVTAGLNLIHNFPILGRLEISNYNDIIAGVQVDEILSKLKPEYRNQIRDTIERRVDEVIDARKHKLLGEEFSDSLKKYTPQEILLQAKVAYLLSYGIEAMAPRISWKHMAFEDYELAVLSAVSMMNPSNQEIEYQHREEEQEMRMYQLTYMSFEAEKMHNESIRSRIKGDRVKSSDELERNISQAIRYVSDMQEPAKLFLKKALLFSGDSTKVDTETWNSLFTSKAADISSEGFVLLAYLSGMTVHMDYPEKRKRNDKQQVKGIGITNYASGDTLTQNRDLHEEIYGKPEVYVPFANNNQIIEALVTTFVNNHILYEIQKISRDFENSRMQWRNPLLFKCDYSPADLNIAQYLIKSYPIFNMIPPLGPEDIVSGVVLSQLQKATGDYNLDRSATITQNLFSRQVYALNKLSEGRK